MNPSPQSPSNEGQKPVGNYRWVICGLLFFSVAVNYIDRLTISILKKPLSEHLGWTDADYGYITAAFSFAYAFGYLLGGQLMDRWGVKKGLPRFVFAWSLAAIAHGFCHYIDIAAQFRVSFPWFTGFETGIQMVTLLMPMTAAGFMFARIALGLTEGGNFPGAIKAVAEWYPVKERAFATGLFNAGTNIGAVLCPVLVPYIYGHFGWEWTFYITGGSGLLWLVAWHFAYDAPEKHKAVSPEELAYIKEGQPPEVEKPKKMPIWQVLKFRAAWGYMIASCLSGPAWGVYQFFLPDFLDKKYGLPLEWIGWITGAFFIIAAVGGILAGWLAGALIKKGWAVLKARKFSLLMCAIAVVPVCLAPFAGHWALAVLIVGIAGSAHQGWSANLFSVVGDTIPKEAISTVVGLGGFVGFFAGGFVNGMVGNVLQATGSYVPIFASFSGMYLLAVLVLQLMLPRPKKLAAA